LQALADYGEESKLLAGGLSLVPLLNVRQVRPRHVIDLGRVDELNYIRLQDGGLMIGALTRQRTVEDSMLVRDHCPLLYEAIKQIGYVRIRNQGTIGGAIVHADPLGELPAVAIAAGARLHVRGLRGDRVLDAVAFFTGGGTTALAHDELLLAVEFPAWVGSVGSRFREFSPGGSGYAIVGVAAMLSIDDAGLVQRIGLGLMGVADCPFDAAFAAAGLLHGRTPDAAVLTQAADAVATAITPNSDLKGSAAYRRHLARTLTEQTLKDAAGQARPYPMH